MKTVEKGKYIFGICRTKEDELENLTEDDCKFAVYVDADSNYEGEEAYYMADGSNGELRDATEDAEVTEIMESIFEPYSAELSEEVIIKRLCDRGLRRDLSFEDEINRY